MLSKVKSESEVAQLCLTLSDPMDYSLPGSSIHGIFQARVLEWGAIAFSEGRVKVTRASEVAQLCPTLCNPTDCSLPGSSVHWNFQAIVLEWIAISFSRGSSQPRAWTWVSHIADRCFIIWATREVRYMPKGTVTKYFNRVILEFSYFEWY